MMKLIKKAAVFTAAVFIALTAACTVYAEKAEKTPIYGEQVKDGVYNIEVDSSSSMFRVVKCELTVSEGKMTAVMTMSGQGYGMLFPGTGEEALAANEDNYIDFVKDADGAKTFTFPVEALDKETACAAWSIKKEKWYDRTLIFMSDDLPKGAVKSNINLFIFIIAAAVIIIAAIFTILLSKREKQRKEE